MRKFQFVSNQIYHVFNRGVDKRSIFLDQSDYYRFIHSLFEFNDEEPVVNLHYYFNTKSMNVESRPAYKDKKPRKILVEILIFTLMSNHFHLLLRQTTQKGIVKFMQKIGTGYTNYFNKKYEREGALFQGKFKAVLINSNELLFYLPQYIHLNPLKLNYGSSTSIDWQKNLKFLEQYRWSSFLDYVGKKNFPSVTSRDFLLNIYQGEKNYRKHITNCLKESGKGEWFESIKGAILD